ALLGAPHPRSYSFRAGFFQNPQPRRFLRVRDPYVLLSGNSSITFSTLKVARSHRDPSLRSGLQKEPLQSSYFALNVAGRFSTYAFRPSLASSLANRRCCSSRSTASADSSGISQPVCTERLMLPTAFAALLGGVNWRAYSITFSMKFSRS